MLLGVSLNCSDNREIDMMTRRFLFLVSAALAAFSQVTPQRLEEQAQAYYDAGMFVETFDDEAAKKGYCLYKVGCKGPTTYNACGVMKWNAGTSYPIQSGHPCIGCSEENYWDNGRLYQRASSFAGFGIESDADTLGKYALGATGVALAGHAILTNINKRKDINTLTAEGEAGDVDVIE